MMLESYSHSLGCNASHAVKLSLVKRPNKAWQSAGTVQCLTVPDFNY